MLNHGERLCNPFNLIKTNIAWHGLIDPGSDPVFCKFESNFYGLRAGFINLKNQLKEGFNTIAKLITKYAPPVENDTEAYKKAICKALNKQPDDVLVIDDLKKLGIAIITHEQGRCIYTDEDINPALVSAGVPSGINGLWGF